MSNDKASPDTEPAEGSAAERSKFGKEGNRMPLPLVLVWSVFFVWMIYYVATYLVPALP